MPNGYLLLLYFWFVAFVEPAAKKKRGSNELGLKYDYTS